MQQEILVILRSSFAERELDINNDAENSKLSPEEKLEEACANGSLKDFLPEVFKNGTPNVFLWQMHPECSFLQLELGESPLEIELYYSITPRYFLATKCFN
ncbi:MAG: hypothetical protein ABJB05_04885 [Parafilimonas sp.]